MDTDLLYTVLLCVDYEEKLLRRYNELFKSCKIEGGSTESYGSLYISKRNLRITTKRTVPYNLILALGADDAADIAKRIYNDYGEIAVACFDLRSSTQDMLRAIQSIRNIFPASVCAVAVHDQSIEQLTRPQDMFTSPSQWLYYQSNSTAEQMEQLIAHQISAFVLHREIEATSVGLRETLNASPDLLKKQSEQELTSKILENLVNVTDAKNAFLATFDKDKKLTFRRGIGQCSTLEGYMEQGFHQKLEKFQLALAEKKVMRFDEEEDSSIVAPLLVQDKQIGILYLDKERPETKNSELLDVFAHHVAFAIENHYLQIEIEEKQALKHELNLASRIQESLLPKSFPQAENLELYGLTKSATEIGGDYFDVITSENGKYIYFCIGDVSGKGVGAGLIMVELRSIIRAFGMKYNSPHDILLHSAELLLKDIARSGKFVSMLFLQWDGKKLLYSSAGHEHILHYHAATGKCDAYRSGGVVLGVDFRSFSRLLKEKELKLEPNDVVVLFTDGATEAHNENGDMFKLVNLQKAIEKYSSLPVKNMIDAILKDVLQFIGNAKQHDDITLLGMKYRPKGSSEKNYEDLEESSNYDGVKSLPILKEIED